MMFAKERERVRSATRAIRDLMVRPGRDLQAGGDVVMGAGLQALAQLALAPLRFVPEVATRVPDTLRELGERVAAIPDGQRRLPAVGFAAAARRRACATRRRCASATSTCWPPRWTARAPTASTRGSWRCCAR
jgi:hypothetical protein